MGTLEDLRAQVEERRVSRAAMLAAANDAVETKRLENELKLDDLESSLSLGTRGLDYSVAFLARTGDMVVVRVPKPVTWARFTSRVRADKDDYDKIQLDFVHACLAYPSKDEFSALCNLEPALLNKASNECGRLAGMRETASAGK
jgi:hypothetical protein